MKQGLIIIDVQNDYFPGGSMELTGMQAAASNCARLVAYFRRKQAPIFHIQHLSQTPAATFFVPATQGCEIHAELQPHAGEALLVKHYPSAFRETELQKMLNQAGIEAVTICGAMTHMCIDTTTRAAFDLGFKCQLVDDACATRDLEFGGRLVKAADVQAAFMAALGAAFAKIATTQQTIDA